MWSFVFALIILIILCSYGTFKRSEQAEDTKCVNENKGTLSPDETCTLRGLAMFIIMFSHLADPSIKVTYFFYVSGILGVAICFVVSGYGLGKGYQQKDKYLKHFLLFKYIRCLLPYFILYLVYTLLVGKEAQIAYEIPRLQMAGSPLWYLKVQLLLYLFFYLIYKYFPFEKYKGWLLTLCCLIYCVAMYSCGVKTYWYKTCLFFPLGVWLSYNDYKIIPILRKHIIRRIFFGLSLLLFIVLYFFGRLGHEFIIDGFYMISFTAFSIGIAQYIRKSYLLELMGKYSLEVYLVHCLVLRLDNRFFLGTKAAAFISLTILVLALSIPLNWVCTRCSSELKNRLSRR